MRSHMATLIGSHKCAEMFDESPLYALDKCSEGQTTLGEAKHLPAALNLIRNAKQGHFLTAQCVHLAALASSDFWQVREGHGNILKDMGVYQKAASDIVKAPALSSV